VLSVQEPQWLTFRGAYASETKVFWPGPGDRQGTIAGCLYTSEFERIALSEREGGHFGDVLVSSNPQRASADWFREAVQLPGRSLYLGHLMQHYGHFLIETLPNLWWTRQLPEFDWLVFHPFHEKGPPPETFRKVLALLGIPFSKVRVIDGPTRLDEVVVPERLFTFHRSANVRARKMYQFLSAQWGGSARVPLSDQGCYYLSRRYAVLQHGRAFVANEVLLEAQMLRLGLDVIYPDRLVFEDEVNVFSHARLLVGAGGSGMHNLVFARPGGLILEIGDSRSVQGFYPTQQLCNELAGWQGTRLPLFGSLIARRPGLEVTWIDPRRIRAAIQSEPLARELLSTRTRRGRRIAGGNDASGYRLLLRGLARAAKEKTAQLWEGLP
jgi:hypothetical protein